MLTLLTSAAVTYAAFVAVAWLAQDKLLYPAPAGATVPVLPGATLERIAAADGTVYALHLPAPDGAPTLVHFHGNGEDLADQVLLARRFAERGMGFFAVEYPGYGLAREQAPTESAIYEAAEVAIGRLRELGVPSERTVLIGVSLGSGVAAEMAVRGHASRLVLVAPYTSIPDVARRVVPLLPVGWILRDRFATESKADQLRLPVLIVHGTDDEVIPFDMGKTLSRRVPGARLLTLEGGRHNDMFSVHAERVFGEIARFCGAE